MPPTSLPSPLQDSPSSETIYDVIIAPSDWGLGHSARIIPLAVALSHLGYRVGIAADPVQFPFFAQELPSISVLPLPGYQVRYAIRRTNQGRDHRPRGQLVRSLLVQSPNLVKTFLREQRWLKQQVLEERIKLIISDSRLGLWCEKLPSVYLTHQLQIFPPTPFPGLRQALRIAHRWVWGHYRQCWVPDFKGEPNLSGELGHPRLVPEEKVHYIGPLSRFALNSDHTFPVEGMKSQGSDIDDIERLLDDELDLLVLISGPEPHRSFFENRVKGELVKTSLRAVILRGIPSLWNTPTWRNGVKVLEKGRIFIFPHLPTPILRSLLKRAKVVLSRSGYSTLMDWVYFRRPLFLVPTPGQSEQEYLARYMAVQGWAVMQEETRFDLIAGWEKAQSHTALPCWNEDKEDFRLLVKDLLSQAQR